MKNLLSRFIPGRILNLSLKTCAIAAVLGLSHAVPATALPAARPAVSVKAVTVSGSATNTITQLGFNDNGTISIEAEQEGNLSHIGHFTGHFSYLAIPSPVSIVLLGTAEITNDDGDRLFFSAVVVELGTGYPYTLAGTLTVTGGTGRFAGATGAIAVSGRDTAELTDRLDFHGTLLLAR